MNINSSLESYILTGCPDRAYYFPNFVTEDEESNLLDHINNAPKPKWTQLKNRRLQNWGGIPQPKGMVPEDIPKWLNDQCLRIFDLNIFDKNVPNHILINEYLPGQGIMPHEDGPMYYPTVSTISLGSHILLDFYKPLTQAENEADRFMFSLLLEPRSLLVLQEDMYKAYLHGIREIPRDEIDSNAIKNYGQIDQEKYPDKAIVERRTRVSLTIRHVTKVSKFNVGSIFLNKKKI